MAEHQDGNSVQQVQVVGESLEVDFAESAHADSAHDNLDRMKFPTTPATSAANYDKHGRRYHNYHEESYWLPDDDLETGRLDIQHHTWLLSLRGKLYISPIPNTVQHVLDVGCGKGHWPVKFAKEHPSAEVLGTDINASPEPAGTPRNCSFMIHNAESAWEFDTKFDFIHSRMIVLGIHDWPMYFKRAWDNLVPGGWLEVQEIQYPACGADDAAEADSPFLLWSKYARDAAAKAGLDTTFTVNFKKQLAEQGFVNIREQPIKWAVCTTPTRLGLAQGNPSPLVLPSLSLSRSPAFGVRFRILCL